MNYSGIIYDDTEHGTGKRLTLLVQGANKDSQYIKDEYKDPHEGILFTDETKEDILSYIKNNEFIDGLTITGGDPLYDDNLKPVYDLIKMFRIKFLQSKTIWLYTDYSWQDFKYWRNINESGLNLGDNYKLRLQIIDLVDVVHCKNVFEVTEYSFIDRKKSYDSNKIIIYKVLNNNVGE